MLAMNAEAEGVGRRQQALDKPLVAGEREAGMGDSQRRAESGEVQLGC